MISMALLKEQLKRNWMVMILTLLGFGFSVILPIFSQTGSHNVLRAQRLIDLLGMSNIPMMIATIVIPFAVVLLLFSYLFNSKAQSTYQMLTDSKSQLFWTSVVSGLILIVVPLLVLAGTLLIRVRFPMDTGLIDYTSALFSPSAIGGARINTLPVIAGFFGRTLVSMLFYYVLFIFASTLSGNWVIATGLFGLIPFVPIFVQRFFRGIADTYIFGFFSPDQVSVRTILAFTNPLAWAETFGRSQNQSTFFMIYIGITVGLLLLAVSAFVSRKMEQADKTIVFPAFKSLLIFLLSVAGMVVMGRYFMSVLHGRWFVYYGFIIGFALVYCITNMIFEKSFSIMPKIKWMMPMMGIVAVLYGGMFLLTTFGMNGITRHVPNQAQVTGVYVTVDTPTDLQDSDFSRLDADITDTRQLHQRIVGTRQIRGDAWDDLTSSQRSDIRSDERDHRSDMRDAFWDSATGGGRRFREQGGQHIYIVYLLNDGERVYRRYALSGEFLYELYNEGLFEE